MKNIIDRRTIEITLVTALAVYVLWFKGGYEFVEEFVTGFIYGYMMTGASLPCDIDMFARIVYALTVIVPAVFVYGAMDLLMELVLDIWNGVSGLVNLITRKEA